MIGIVILAAVAGVAVLAGRRPNGPVPLRVLPGIGGLSGSRQTMTVADAKGCGELIASKGASGSVESCRNVAEAGYDAARVAVNALNPFGSGPACGFYEALTGVAKDPNSACARELAGK